jgi:hypothetical protein
LHRTTRIIYKIALASRTNRFRRTYRFRRLWVGPLSRAHGRPTISARAASRYPQPSAALCRVPKSLTERNCPLVGQDGGSWSAAPPLQEYQNISPSSGGLARSPPPVVIPHLKALTPGGPPLTLSCGVVNKGRSWWELRDLKFWWGETLLLKLGLFCVWKQGALVLRARLRPTN